MYSTIVGEDIILPRGTIFLYRAMVGRIRTKLDILPFNQTPSHPTWREDDILPYNGWADSLHGIVHPTPRGYFL